MLESTSTPTRAWTLSQADVVEFALLLGLSLFLPFMIHFFPAWDDTPWGMRLLPLFYAPLIAAFRGKMTVAVSVAVAAPWVNHFLLGMPALTMAFILVLELLAFALLIQPLVRRLPAWMVGPAAALATRFVLWPAFFALPNFPPADHAYNWLITGSLLAWPGLLVLAALGWWLGRTSGGTGGPAHA